MMSATSFNGFNATGDNSALAVLKNTILANSFSLAWISGQPKFSFVPFTSGHLSLLSGMPSPSLSLSTTGGGGGTTIGVNNIGCNTNLLSVPVLLTSNESSI